MESSRYIELSYSKNIWPHLNRVEGESTCMSEKCILETCSGNQRRFASHPYVSRYSLRRPILTTKPSDPLHTVLYSAHSTPLERENGVSFHVCALALDALMQLLHVGMCLLVTSLNLCFQHC